MKFFIIISTFIFALFSAVGCNTKDPPPATATQPAPEFTLAIYDELGVREPLIYAPVVNEYIPPVTVRGQAEYNQAHIYLSAVADAYSSVYKITQVIQGIDPKNNLQLWVKLLPVLIQEAPQLIYSAKSLKEIEPFLKSTGGLTKDERQQLSRVIQEKYFATENNANSIADATVEAALANLNLYNSTSNARTKK